MGAYLKDKGTVNSLVTEITIKQTLLQFLFVCRSSIPLKLGHLVPVSTVSILNRNDRKVIHLGTITLINNPTKSKVPKKNNEEQELSHLVMLHVNPFM